MSSRHLSAAVTPSAVAARIPAASAFYLLASITVTFLAGSSAPTPLYPVYQAEWGFSAVTVTFIFGIYAIAVLMALLVAGRLSDHVGRRPVLIAAALVQAATMLLFASASGVGELVAARVIQGLSTGAAVTAVGAGLLDLDKERGATANAIAPPIGTALGGVLAGTMVRFLPEPTHLVYLLLAVVFIAQAIAVARIAEPGTLRAGALRSLKPQLAIPPGARGPLALAVPALVSSWALGGFYASLSPMLVSDITGAQGSLLGGLALFVLAGSAGVAILLLRNLGPRGLTVVGAATVIAGVALVLPALSHRWLPLFFAATVFAGAGFGTAFQGAVRTVVASTAAHDRAGVLSVAFIVSYLSMGVPAVFAGYLVARHGDIGATARQFGAVVIALALVALGGALLQRKR
jgi:predicted MFS family arabinose efflux permease